jgi:CheY-like chemotaxis protein
MEHRDPLTESDLAIFPDSERITAPGGERDRNNREPLPTGKGQRKKPGPAGNRVLLFSGIFEVALYRAEVLRAHGLEVRTPRTKDEAVAIIQRGEVDVMVLTYTLPSETVHELSDLVRQYCAGCHLVAISESGRVDERVEPDAVVIANEGPAALVEAIRRLRRLQ